jgi:hypothetical protein
MLHTDTISLFHFKFLIDANGCISSAVLCQAICVHKHCSNSYGSNLQALKNSFGVQPTTAHAMKPGTACVQPQTDSIRNAGRKQTAIPRPSHIMS